MEGGTTFHFVTDGIEAALARAREAAGDHDIRIGGGVSVIRQYLEKGLIDELHIAIAPTLLGNGESLFAGLNMVELGYEVAEHAASEAAMHLVIARR
jgi:dihydrofolate reductase